MNRSVSPTTAASLGEGFAASRANRVARNAVTSSDVLKAARNPIAMRSYNDTYGISLRRPGAVTNQRSSGRCWMFATFNVARAKTIELLDVESFEFSQAYGMFYDKLEKANSFLANVIDTASRPADDRLVGFLLDAPAADGGQFSYGANLIAKWGLVPKSAMPETACSRNSSQMNHQLQRLLRRDAGELRAAAARGAGTEELEEMRATMLEGVHRLLAICLGEPPVRFDFVCGVGKNAKVDAAKLSDVLPLSSEADGKDAPVDEPDDVVSNVDANAGDNPVGVDSKDAAPAKPVKEPPRRILTDRAITPQEFAERYVGFDADGYVDLVSVPGERLPFGHVYGCSVLDSVCEGSRWRVLNSDFDVLEDAVVRSLKEGVPCYMACDVMQEFGRNLEDFPGVLALGTIDAEGLFDLDLTMDKAEMFDLREASFTHAMTFQGVQLGEDGRPAAWRVENSWGKESCKNGYLLVSADWFRSYGGEVVVERRFVDEAVRALWDEAPIEELDPWSPLTSACFPRA